MGYSRNSALQHSLRQWFRLADWQHPFAVTLTLRQSVTVNDGHLATQVWLTETVASQNLRHFLNKLNRSIYGKASARFGRGVSCIPVLEGGGLKRLHYHAVIDCPRPEIAQEFPLLIAEHWRSTQWGYWQIDCQPHPDQNWINYITKYRDKPEYSDAIDWVNLRLP
ncbi:rolling circle replication-associated protein [Sphingorhabdus sp.]|jgi:hypothetical protein|uniref:rolling circle replication-associated protein n=1 Tax=Sphingorhabdus sp. TaxID=1902408 RepID=UPI0040546F96